MVLLPAIPKCPSTNPFPGLRRPKRHKYETEKKERGPLVAQSDGQRKRKMPEKYVKKAALEPIAGEPEK